MSYWQEKIVPKWECTNCGGSVRKDGSVPVVKGHIMRYKCIRCGSTGSTKHKLAYDGPKVSGEITEA